MARLVPTPGSTTATKIVPGGNQGAVAARMKAPATAYWGGTSWVISTSCAPGQRDTRTAFNVAAYPSCVPKSVRRAITGGRIVNSAAPGQKNSPRGRNIPAGGGRTCPHEQSAHQTTVPSGRPSTETTHAPAGGQPAGPPRPESPGAADASGMPAPPDPRVPADAGWRVARPTRSARPTGSPADDSVARGSGRAPGTVSSRPNPRRPHPPTAPERPPDRRQPPPSTIRAARQALGALGRDSPPSARSSGHPKPPA